MNGIDNWSTSARWLYALKPGSWLKLLVPMLLGQAIGAGARGAWPPGALVVGTAFTVSGLAFIVLLNDWGDREIDRVKRAMFPDGCSPKTIPDRVLGAGAVLAAGLCAGGLALMAAVLGGWWLARPELPWIGAGGMLIFIAYTLPPVRLNYRGGGEFLEMLGVGAVLPWFNAHAVSGVLWTPGLALLPGFMLFALAGAVASGLSDEASDRAGGKTTVATRFGNRSARAVIECAVLAGIAAWAAAAWQLGDALPRWAMGASVLALVVHGWRMRGSSRAAVTGAFPALARYKRHLHRAVWQGASLAAAGLLLGGLS